MMGRVSGKVAIVTGGALGMGRAHAMMLADEGARVVVADINEAQGQATAAQIRENGKEAIFVRQDVSSAEDWQRVVSTALENFGRIDVLVNNAGMLVWGALEETSDADWDRLMNVNAKGVFLGCKHVLPAMRDAGGGSIINISSVYAQVGGFFTAAYIASKGAVRMLTKAAASDFSKYNVRVNSVYPGVVATEMTKDVLTDAESIRNAIGRTLIPRAGRPEEIASAVVFLASDESSYMTGSEITVDGGYSSC